MQLQYFKKKRKTKISYLLKKLDWEHKFKIQGSKSEENP